MVLRKIPRLTALVLTLTLLAILLISPFVHSQAPFLQPLPPFTASTTITLTWIDGSGDSFQTDFYTVYKDSLPIGLIDYNGDSTYSFDDPANSDRETHYYEISATDLDGLESELSNQEATTIDITAPQTTASISPQTPDGNNEWYVSKPLITLTALDQFEEGSGIHSTLYCVDSNNFCTPDTAYETPFEVLLEGSIFVRYYSVDNAGNSENPLSSGQFKIDLSNPTGQSIVLDDGNDFSYDGIVSASLEIGADSFSGLDFCEISWDNGETWENIGLENQAGPHEYEPGIYTVLYQCNDFAGRKTSPHAFDEIFVSHDGGEDNDTNPPLISFVDPDEGYAMSGVYTILADVNDNTKVAQVDFFMIEKQGNTYCFGQNCHIGSGEIVWSVLDASFDEVEQMFSADLDTSLFADGDYNFVYSAKDLVGNMANLEISVFVDNTAPQISELHILPQGPKARGSIVTIEANASDNVSGIYLIEAKITRPNGLQDIVELYGDQPLFSGDYFTETDFESGTYTVELTAYDSAWNISNTMISAFELHYSYVVDIFLSAEELLKGETLTVTGVLLDDSGSPIGGYELELLFPTEKITVATNPNTGDFFFDYDTSALSGADYEVVASVTAPNGLQSSDTEFFTITEDDQPEPPPSDGTGGGGGGSGGSGSGSGDVLLLEFDNNCVGKDIIATVLDLNGGPVGGATVTFIFGSSTVGENVTNEQGETVFIFEQTGTYYAKALTLNAESLTQKIEISECLQESVSDTPITELPSQAFEAANETYAELMDLMDQELGTDFYQTTGLVSAPNIHTNPVVLVLGFFILAGVFIGSKNFLRKKNEPITQFKPSKPVSNEWPENPL